MMCLLDDQVYLEYLTEKDTDAAPVQLLKTVVLGKHRLLTSESLQTAALKQARRTDRFVQVTETDVGRLWEILSVCSISVDESQLVAFQISETVRLADTVQLSGVESELVDLALELNPDFVVTEYPALVKQKQLGSSVVVTPQECLVYLQQVV